MTEKLRAIVAEDESLIRMDIVAILEEAGYEVVGQAGDGEEAVKWLRKAAEQNHGMAQAFLGIEYVAGRGVPKNLEEGVKWIRKSAEQGNYLGQVVLGGLYRKGEGVPKDDEEAFRWFKKSAAQGFEESQRLLGHCYEQGEGVAKNPVEAAMWYRKAAEQGEKIAQTALGLCLVKGAGVPRDDVSAYMWFNLSAAAGHDIAVTFREKLAKSMTPEQIAEAQKMSREWKPKKKHIPVVETPNKAADAADRPDLDEAFGISPSPPPSPKE
jgi:TPR repeat protein